MINKACDYFATQEFIDLIGKMIDEALMKDEQYISLEEEFSRALDTKDIKEIEKTANAVQARAEEVVFIQAWKTAFTMAVSSLN